MKILALFAVIILLSPAFTASADSLSGEFGLGFVFSSGSDIYLLRYRHFFDPLMGISTFGEAVFASWDGENHSTAVGLAPGIQLKITPNQAVSITPGLTHISRTTENLGQPFEFYGRVAYERTIGKAILSIAYIHFSDAKFIFEWSGPNRGENFVTLSIGMLF